MIRERLPRENRLSVFCGDATLLQTLHGMAREVISRTGCVYPRNDRLPPVAVAIIRVRGIAARIVHQNWGVACQHVKGVDGVDGQVVGAELCGVLAYLSDDDAAVAGGVELIARLQHRPLGLDASDPREAQRRQLNADLLVNYRQYGADHIVDFDVAVRDSSNGSKVAPQYLTSGAPNDAYHMRLAEYLAEAVNDFPPRAEL